MSTVAGVVDALRRAHADGGRVPPPTASLPGLDLDGAYAIQEAVVAELVAAGQRPVGWKIGMAGAVGRGPDTPGPIYGRLLSAMVVADGATVRVDALHEPFVEGELAFVLARPLRGPGVAVADVLAATAGVQPALEIFARRLVAEASDLRDMVADNALCARVVFGGAPVPLDAADPRLAGLVLHRDDAIAGTGAGAQVLGDPARAVAWLANTLATRGQGLEAGARIITGAIAGAHVPEPGDRFRAEFDHYGTVEVHIG